MGALTYKIAAVERDTGLSKDVLRMWERRYRFPTPARDGNGDRLYSTDPVERLRLIKRLMDMGHLPGKLIATPYEQLSALAPRRVTSTPAISDDEQSGLDELVEVIRRHEGSAYLQAMQHRLARQGLQRFVQDTVAPLIRRVGEAWEQGALEVFEEHLFTELTKRLLRQSIASPLLAETLFALEGAECIPLGAQTPLSEIDGGRLRIRPTWWRCRFPSPFRSARFRACCSNCVRIWTAGSSFGRVALALPGSAKSTVWC